MTCARAKRSTDVNEGKVLLVDVSQCTKNLNVNILQASSVHHGVNVVRCVFEHYMSVLVAMLECMSNSWCIIIAWVVPSLNNALLVPWWTIGLEATVRWTFLNDAWPPTVILAQIFTNILIGSIRSPMILRCITPGQSGRCDWCRSG